MHEWSQEASAKNLPVAALFSRHPLTIGIAYLVAYALLDWVSFISPIAPIGITPWNPATGLSFALVLLFGREYVPWLFVAPMLVNAFVLDLPMPVAAHLLGSLVIGAGYGAAATLLTLPRLDFDRTLSSKRSLMLLIGVAAISTGVVAIAYVGILTAFGLVAPAKLIETTAHQWIGDMIGITVLTPFLLILFTRKRHLVPSFEMAALVLVLIATLAAVFGLSDTFRVKQFYLFFLPVMWTAVRFGLEGVTAGLVLTQVGLMVAMQYAGIDANEVTAYQALMIVLALTGLTIGTLVSEQLRTQAQLRRNQEALERAARLDTMGAFAAALAHEINQPLTAIANYTRIAKMAVEKQSPDNLTAREAAGHAVAQVDRAAEVVRRLRDFIQLGRAEMRPHQAVDLIREAISHCRFETQAGLVSVETRIARNLPSVICDGLQIQQVLVNLIRNAAESISSSGRSNGRIVLEADLTDANRVLVSVRDNGPGFDPEILARALTPFTTTKQEGFGLGLALARSTAETHGGQLVIESAGGGAAVSFTLPTSIAETTSLEE
ncbi:MASE1 domain-containing protein [Hyphomicrobium sp. CS1GBMeth3]|uniref:MASE1 domain-containing protein n=1 Tax=Hyphomicrobium sp. CS1GBMeth3 TaxID=1892845 RepID=UPI000931C5A6|nr:MASE1 domain-containing protein [Hyphomicrobium sp. CS1GBMeth3]